METTPKINEILVWFWRFAGKLTTPLKLAQPDSVLYWQTNPGADPGICERGGGPSRSLPLPSSLPFPSPSSPLTNLLCTLEIAKNDETCTIKSYTLCRNFTQRRSQVFTNSTDLSHYMANYMHWSGARQHECRTNTYVDMRCTGATITSQCRRDGGGAGQVRSDHAVIDLVLQWQQQDAIARTCQMPAPHTSLPAPRHTVVTEHLQTSRAQTRPHARATTTAPPASHETRQCNQLQCTRPHVQSALNTFKHMRSAARLLIVER